MCEDEPDSWVSVSSQNVQKSLHCVQYKKSEFQWLSYLNFLLRSVRFCKSTSQKQTLKRDWIGLLFWTRYKINYADRRFCQTGKTIKRRIKALYYWSCSNLCVSHVFVNAWSQKAIPCICCWHPYQSLGMCTEDICIDICLSTIMVECHTGLISCSCMVLAHCSRYPRQWQHAQL